jgi:hypothetical protein
MATDRYYFDHDYTARNDDKILELRSIYGPEGYGIFWMILETMAENDNGGVKATLMGGLSLGYGVAKDRLMAIVVFCVEIDLFYEKEGYYFSRRMQRHKNMRKGLSDAGKAGAEKRWKNSPPIAPLMQNKTDQSKGDQNKDVLPNTHSSVPEGKELGIDVVVDAAKKVWEDQKWREQVCMAHYMKPEDLRQWMYQYNASLSNDRIEGFNPSRYKKMFNGWLNKQKEKGYKLPEKPSNGQSQLKTLTS